MYFFPHVTARLRRIKKYAEVFAGSYRPLCITLNDCTLGMAKDILHAIPGISAALLVEHRRDDNGKTCAPHVHAAATYTPEWLGGLRELIKEIAYEVTGNPDINIDIQQLHILPNNTDRTLLDAAIRWIKYISRQNVYFGFHKYEHRATVIGNWRGPKRTQYIAQIHAAAKYVVNSIQLRSRYEPKRFVSIAQRMITVHGRRE